MDPELLQGLPPGKRQKIEAEMQQLANKLAEADRKLREERALAASADEKLQQVTQQLHEEREYRKFMETCMVGSKTQRSISILAYFNAELPLFPWASAGMDQIQSLWTDLQSSLMPLNDDFPDENADLHPTFQRMIEKCAAVLGAPVKWFIRPYLGCPPQYPDLAAVAPGISHCTYADCRIVVELKLPQNKKAKEGIAEVLDYFKEVVTNRPETEMGDHRCRVAIYSDFTSVMAFFTKNNVHEAKRSDLLDLFPTNWRTMEEPTAGFTLLCHALMLPVPHCKLVEIDNVSTLVRGTLYSGLENSVYVVHLPDKDGEFAVKLANPLAKNSCALVQREIVNLKAISSIEAMKEFIVPMLDCRVRFGFVMELGTPLPHWFSQMRADLEKEYLAADRDNTICYTDEEEKKIENALCDQARPHLAHLISALETLHGHHWIHTDIRPRNLIILNGSCRLIDWGTAIHKTGTGTQTCIALYHGQFDAFWPDQRFFTIENNPLHWDLFGLAFSFAYLGAVMPEKQLLADDQTRAVEIERLSQKPHRISGIAARMVHFLEENQTNLFEGLRRILNE